MTASTGPGAIEFRDCPAVEQPAAALLDAMAVEMAELYDGHDLNGPDMPKAGPAEFAPPGGVLIVGYQGEIAVCCGGIKRLPDGACEIKRMFVIPPTRGRGIALVLLHELEQRARGMGYAVVRLDTGPRQGHMQRMFEREGYAPIGNFNANPIASFFGEKRLQRRGLKPRHPRPTDDEDPGATAASEGAPPCSRADRTVQR